MLIPAIMLILSNLIIPITPLLLRQQRTLSRSMPPELLLMTSTSIPDELTQSSRPHFLHPPLADLPSSESENGDYTDDLKMFTTAARRASDDDTNCLEYLYKHVSATSLTSIKIHRDYALYQLLPIGTRSYPFYKMADDTKIDVDQEDSTDEPIYRAVILQPTHHTERSDNNRSNSTNCRSKHGRKSSWKTRYHE